MRRVLRPSVTTPAPPPFCRFDVPLGKRCAGFLFVRPRHIEGIEVLNVDEVLARQGESGGDGPGGLVNVTTTHHGLLTVDFATYEGAAQFAETLAQRVAADSGGA